MLKRTIPCSSSSILLDRVYEHVTLPSLIRQSIDTPQVQRLRQLRQLGASSYLYPGATHTRFEHSIGVCHLAGSWMHHLKERQPDFPLFSSSADYEESRNEVMLAALLHDVGHGPFSHVAEHIIFPALGKKFDHEEMGVVLADKVICGELKLGKETSNRVCSMIMGDTKALAKDNKLKAFLPSIIHNDKSGVDVDRLDYFVRDAMCCFGKHLAEVRSTRLFRATRIMTNEGGETEIAFENKLAVTIRELCSLRARMHRSVYQHPVVLRVGYMIGDIIAEAARQDSDFENFLLGSLESPDLFLRLGDHIFDSIGAGVWPKAVRARKLFERLQRRQLYGMLGICPLNPHDKFSTSREELLKDALARKVCAGLGPDVASVDQVKDSLIVIRVTVNHGAKDKDPLAGIKFYNKKDSSSAASLLPSLQQQQGGAALAVDTLTPACFQERELVVICREPTSDSVISSRLRKVFGDVSRDVGFNLQVGLMTVNA